MLTFDMLPVGDINTSATTIDIVNDEIILKPYLLKEDN